ncbi:MAG: N-acetylmuramic acid 6-phosphate etherase [Bacteroidota bacterium]|jgi:N-acetylmuramic acid 6-phosphate etherase|nr:N-acetylmuramic acid 6-phosphate etherase [Ignavibacteria bacterium]HEX2962171.1 N-acetylmuramic acid 6-phosphate etherase [Ignavibacteriales bacterium]MCU7500276.1 N-acetylmuramic acid 6-phosphate etherase [Ignavibacteria bacterium]MCU7513794.1 N-acetylmuramic acid 6-phosphate etherase [Ignavibacteria bacterium]MCU7520068.1 N-acetylmuramic acid 6-phosphate etherase [Ignavibacteria bacterium]
MSADTKKLFAEIASLTTEQRNPNSMDIDARSTGEILRIINNEDKQVPLAVEKEIPYIEQAVEIIVKALKNGGRLLYFGAGTSGRLGVVDASECPPTFGTPFGMIDGFIAGGKEAMFRAQEGAEDYEENGANDVLKANVTDKDVVCGIAASRRTPYVVGAVKKAKELGAKTLFVTCNPRENFNIKEVDVAMCPYVGPEVIMGSTRMKSGTAQKLVLNMLTTTAMVRMGKVYENMMIDLQMTNKKLVERSKRIVMTITGASYDEAAEYLQKAGGHVKTALVMFKANVTAEEAKIRLEKADGFVRRAIEDKF